MTDRTVVNFPRFPAFKTDRVRLESVIFVRHNRTVYAVFVNQCFTTGSAVEMQREDKQLELVLENFQSKLNEFKGQIYALIFKLEHERDNVSWTTVLDTFAVFSTQYTAIMKYLSYEKLPQLRNYSVLPLMLNPERDEELARITENRVPALSHDIVPDFLRTKTEPEVEHKLMQVKTILIECI